MLNEDYSKHEVHNVVKELLDVHIAKLKPEEIRWLTWVNETNKYSKIGQIDRANLVAMYDRMGEAGY